MFPLWQGNRFAFAPLASSVGLLLLLLGLSLGRLGSVSAQTSQEPAFLGVSGCAASTCHGSTIARSQTRILRNEYRTWLNEDSHSRAYRTLEGERSSQIVANLQRFGVSIGDASSSELCLDCHATNPEPARRGPGFRIEEGVTCESCHGPSRGWIARHDEDLTLEQRSLLGMTPTWDPARRGEVCLSCHLGQGGRFVTHRLMAAGHPRLAFELETFTQLQPAHFRVDPDYRQRKPLSGDQARVWAIGQAAYVKDYLAFLDSTNTDGGWPEFSRYDCFSCHRPISRDADPPGRPSVRSGIPHLNRSSALLFREIVAVRESSRLEALDSALGSLFLTESGPRRVSSAQVLNEVVSSTIRRTKTLDWTRDDLEAIAQRLASVRMAEACRTYSDAEQVTMALQALVAGLEERGLTEARLLQARRDLEALFSTTAREADFQVGDFRRALTGFRTSFR